MHWFRPGSAYSALSDSGNVLCKHGASLSKIVLFVFRFWKCWKKETTLRSSRALLVVLSIRYHLYFNFEFWNASICASWTCIFFMLLELDCTIRLSHEYLNYSYFYSFLIDLLFLIIFSISGDIPCYNHFPLCVQGIIITALCARLLCVYADCSCAGSHFVVGGIWIYASRLPLQACNLLTKDVTSFHKSWWQADSLEQLQQCWGKFYRYKRLGRVQLYAYGENIIVLFVCTDHNPCYVVILVMWCTSLA